MDEHLYLHPGSLRYRADVIQREFTCQDHAGEPEFPQRQHSFEIVRDHLGGRMQREIGEVPPDDTCDAKVLHDDAVGVEFVQDGESFDCGSQLRFVYDGVERDIHLPAFRPGDGKELAELKRREVHGLGARGKGVEAKVYRIRAGVKGGEGGLEGTGGREKLYFVHDIVFHHLVASTPYPKRAKSPRTGSSGNTSASAEVSLRAADIEAHVLLTSPSFFASWSTCVSNGITRVLRSMKSDHRPRSTGESLRTIHLRNMHTRLQAEWQSCGMTPHDPPSRKREHIAATAFTASPPQFSLTNPPRDRCSSIMVLYALRNAFIVANVKNR